MYRTHSLLLTIACAASIAAPAFAGVGNPKSTGIVEGRAQIQYKAVRYGDDDKSDNNDQTHEIEAYYGVNDWLKLGVEYIMENEPGENLEVEAHAINATLLATRQGDWWLSTAAFVAYEAEDGDNDTGVMVLIAERKEGPLNIRANLALKRDVGAGRDSGVEYTSALQLRYDWRDYLKPMLEWHAEYGTFNDTHSLGDQEHYIGPVIGGTLFKLGEGELTYAAGYYWGLTHASADNAQRLLIEYAFPF